MGGVGNWGRIPVRPRGFLHCGLSPRGGARGGILIVAGRHTDAEETDEH